MQNVICDYKRLLYGISLFLLIGIFFVSYKDVHYDHDRNRIAVTYDQMPVVFPTEFKEKLNLASKLTRANRVTRVIHQSWKSTELPSERMERWSATWRTCFPNWIYLLWTDEENRALVARYYPWFLKKYDALPRHIMRVDTVRYLYMHQYGGIYADLDTECLQPFEKLLNNTIVLGAMDGDWSIKMPVGHIQNSFMYSQPGHPFWIELVEEIFLAQKFGGVEDSTGPILMMRKLKDYLKRGGNDVMIYPGQFFNPFSWITNKNPDCIIQGGMNGKQLKKCRDSFIKGSYVVQYHTKTWAGGKA